MCYILRIAEHLAEGLREGASGGHEARILLRRLDIPGHVDFYVLKLARRLTKQAQTPSKR
jgi:hypothetical protein